MVWVVVEAMVVEEGEMVVSPGDGGSESVSLDAAVKEEGGSQPELRPLRTHHHPGKLSRIIGTLLCFFIVGGSHFDRQ